MTAPTARPDLPWVWCPRCHRFIGTAPAEALIRCQDCGRWTAAGRLEDDPDFVTWLGTAEGQRLQTLARG